MQTRPLRIALFGNQYQAGKAAGVRRVFNSLQGRGIELFIDRAYYSFLTQRLHIDVACKGVFEGYIYTDVDFVVSLGGDGTFLRAANIVGEKQTPIVGVNLGRLGFLADIPPEGVAKAIGNIAKGNYSVHSLSVIKVDTAGVELEASPFALNDIAVLKRDVAAMISIRCAINGHYLTTYQADGLIIATPTGSTAYNLSNGGPIIVPSAHDLVLTPVAPHSLNARPIVVSDDSTITLDVESRSHNFLVAVDGRSERMREGTRLTITRAPYSVHAVRQPGSDYFTTLRQKLMWNGGVI